MLGLQHTENLGGHNLTHNTMLPKSTHLVFLWLIYSTSEVATNIFPSWGSSCGVAPTAFQIPGLRSSACLSLGNPTACPKRRKRIFQFFSWWDTLFPFHFTIFHFSITRLNLVHFQPPRKLPFQIHGLPLPTPMVLLLLGFVLF